MFDYGKILVDGSILSVIGSIYLIAMLAYNPRMALNPGDYPPDIIDAVPPKTKNEQRLAMIWGIPFLLFSVAIPLWSALSFQNQIGGNASFWILFGHVLGVSINFFLVDLIFLDLLLFCTITPKFLVIPGTEGFAGYKDKLFHLKGHTKGFFFYILPLSAVFAALVSLF